MKRAARDLHQPRGDSESRTTASTAATKGCRFAARVARFAPIRWIARNRGRSSRPAGRASRTRGAPRSPSRRSSPGRRSAAARRAGARPAAGARPRSCARASTSASAARRRPGTRPTWRPCRRPRTIPPRSCASSPPPEPAAEPHPDRRDARGRPEARAAAPVPSASPRKPAKIGIAPRTRPIVDTLVTSTAKTKSWLRKSMPAATARSGRSRRWTRGVRSAYRVSPTKVSPARRSGPSRTGAAGARARGCTSSR